MDGRVWGGGCKVLLQGRANQADTREIEGGEGMSVRTGTERVKALFLKSTIKLSNYQLSNY